jgi:hypothetical protein
VLNGKTKIEEYKNDDPQMLFCICRSKNKNLVAYEVNLVKDEEGNYVKTDDKFVIKESDPVNSYWITGEESYIAENKKKGIDDRRSELNFIERTMAYGISATKNADGTYTASIVPCPRKFNIEFTTDGRVIATMEIQGKKATVTRMFVKSVERRFLHPKCLFVDIYGITEDGEEVIDRVLP